MGHELLDATSRFQIVSRVCRTKDSLLAIARPEFLQVNDGDSALELIHEIEWTNLVFGQPVLGEKMAQWGRDVFGHTPRARRKAFFTDFASLEISCFRLRPVLMICLARERRKCKNLLGYVKRCAGTLKTFHLYLLTATTTSKREA